MKIAADAPTRPALRYYGGNGTGRDNASRECIWFSPHCEGEKKQRRGKATDFANLPMFAEVQP